VEGSAFFTVQKMHVYLILVSFNARTTEGLVNGTRRSTKKNNGILKLREAEGGTTVFPTGEFDFFFLGQQPIEMINREQASLPAVNVPIHLWVSCSAFVAAALEWMQ